MLSLYPHEKRVAISFPFPYHFSSMKKYRGFIIFIAALTAISFIPMPKVVKIILMVIVLFVFSFVRRNIFFYLHANSLTNSGKLSKAWKWYERAIRSGLSGDGKVSVASLYIQYGDMDRGEQLLKEYQQDTKHPKTNNVDALAQMLMSLIVNKKGDSAQALSILENLKATGYKNTTLIVNMMTIELDQDKPEQARSEWEGCGFKLESDITLKEVYGRLLLVEGKWPEAYSLYADIARQRVLIAAGLVHMAQCCIHYGEASSAIKSLEAALRAPYNKTSSFRKENVQKLHDLLKDPVTRLATARAIDNDRETVAKGLLPKPYPSACPSCSDDQLEGFAEKEKKLVKTVRTERVPNTDINEDDEAYLKSHHLEEE